MPTPHQVQTIWKGILNFSGRSQRNGVDRNQNTTKPTNWLVVVGILDPKVFGIRAKDGQIAVKQTAMSRPPFQPVRSQSISITQSSNSNSHCTAFQMKLSKILCDSGMKLPLKPQEYRFCTVNPMCHFKPIHAIKIEKSTIISLLTTMMSIA